MDVIDLFGEHAEVFADIDERYPLVVQPELDPAYTTAFVVSPILEILDSHLRECGRLVARQFRKVQRVRTFAARCSKGSKGLQSDLATSLPLTRLVFAFLSLAAWIGVRRMVGVRTGQVKVWEKDNNED